MNINRFVGLLVLAIVLLTLSGCSYHRRTNVYGDTVTEEQQDDDYPEEQLSNAPYFNTTWGEFTESLLSNGFSKDAKGYVKDANEWCLVNVEGGESKPITIQVTFCSTSYSDIIENHKSEYNHCMKNILDAAGCTYDAARVEEYINKAEELNGMSYDISDNAYVYAQVYAGQVLIIIMAK